MTCIIGWIAPGPAPGEESVFAVGDSRVIDGNGVLLDDVAKLMALPIRCTWAEGVYYNHTLAFAFAGSTLLGLNTYAHLADYCVSLLGPNPEAVPGLDDISQLAAELVANQRHEFRENRGTDNACEVLLFGHCHVSGRLRLFRIDPFGFGEADTSDVAKLQVLGSHQQEIGMRVLHERSRCSPGTEEWLMAPQSVLRSVLDSREYDGIGGGLKLAIANARGVQLFSGTSPVFAEDRRGVMAHAFYGSLLKVGPCFLAKGVVPTQ
jgi:hypothetical protein